MGDLTSRADMWIPRNVAKNWSCSLLLSWALPCAAATSLYPDMLVRADDLYDHDIVTSVQPGRVHLRLSAGTANTGAGALHVYGVLPENGDGTQDVNQRIFDDEGGYTDVPAGMFVYHSTHGHVHLEDWCEYRIRAILPANGVGAILATGGKTSFCLLDTIIYDSQLPNFSAMPVYTECGTQTQGISVGWLDVYGKNLPGQNIDVTDIPDGVYWLEVEVDPSNFIQESNEANNATRIQVVIGQPGTVLPDAYEPNDSLAEVEGRAVGAPNSPHLGPTAPELQIDGLTVELSGDNDWYRFYLAATGTSSDEVEIFFAHSQGDLDLHLYNAAGVKIRQSISINDDELISLNGLAPGWYSAVVLGYNGAMNPDYSLRIDPPGGEAPTITTLSPAAGNVVLQHGTDSFVVEWSSSDAQSDPVWVSVFVNQNPVLDGSEILVPGLVNLDASYGSAVLNSAEIAAGTWWVYLGASDGGAVGGDWSEGSITFANSATPAPPSVPVAARLSPARPNPFNPRTTLRLELMRDDWVVWEILDVRGRRVRLLNEGVMSAGLHEVHFAALDQRGLPLASGIYYNRVRLKHEARTQKLVLLK